MMLLSPRVSSFVSSHQPRSPPWPVPSIPSDRRRGRDPRRSLAAWAEQRARRSRRTGPHAAAGLCPAGRVHQRAEALADHAREKTRHPRRLIPHAHLQSRRNRGGRRSGNSSATCSTPRFGGSARCVILHALSATRASPDEPAEIQQVIDQYRQSQQIKGGKS